MQSLAGEKKNLQIEQLTGMRSKSCLDEAKHAADVIPVSRILSAFLRPFKLPNYSRLQ